jgi:hypothetical protein
MGSRAELGRMANSFGDMAMRSGKIDSLTRIFHELTGREREDGHAIPRNAGRDAHIRGCR